MQAENTTGHFDDTFTYEDIKLRDLNTHLHPDEAAVEYKKQAARCDEAAARVWWHSCMYELKREEWPGILNDFEQCVVYRRIVVF